MDWRGRVQRCGLDLGNLHRRVPFSVWWATKRGALKGGDREVWPTAFLTAGGRSPPHGGGGGGGVVEKPWIR